MAADQVIGQPGMVWHKLQVVLCAVRAGLTVSNTSILQLNASFACVAVFAAEGNIGSFFSVGGQHLVIAVLHHVW
jgi:hypothetical protein